MHSRYERRLADAVVGGRRLVIRLRVRRLFCDAAGCAAVTFAEQVPGLTMRYARRSRPARQALERLGLALAGRTGARLAAGLGFGSAATPCYGWCAGCPIRRCGR